MEAIKNLFGKVEKPEPKRRRTERGDLLDYFLSVLNPARKKDGIKPMRYGQLSWHLEAIPTTDLYALQSKMEDARRRGYSPSKRFWYELNPEKYAGKFDQKLSTTPAAIPLTSTK